ncbi:rhamnogalacturonan lyase family protein [Horticoccus sp. 23ND18S-11]|uniref:rhamnogalacturonan lyase family protein n=1 Tax=Horticoccus sp. 23ND18S-11 TaxID=3391832 RepID=UPI0039C9BB17
MTLYVSTLLRRTALLFWCGAVALAQNPPPGAPPTGTNPLQRGTTPGAHNDDTLRELTPEEIYPNLNFYAINPLHKPGAPLGWAKERIEENIDRGVVVLVAADRKAYVSWRLLKTDPVDIAFNVYRRTAGGAAIKINAAPLARTTDLVDAAAPLDQANTWEVRTVVNGREVAGSAAATAGLSANSAPQNYRAIKLRDDVTSISMAAVGDLDGDGVYDFVVKHPGGGKDPGRTSVSRDTYKFDGYNGKTGAFMWRIDLGWNVDMGIWWTPLVVRDLDGDNKAEVCLRTKPYAASLAEALPGARAGNALEGPEWLTVYNGETGKEIDHADWIELGKVQDWGDNTGNRASRHMLATAYLDGKTPAVLVVRGTYGMMKIDAWTLENKKLKKLWRWTNERAPFLFHGQGQHSLKVGDVDGDGRDEIFNGSVAISHDGRSLWSSGLGHGDRFYLTDIDPSRPGLEIAYIIEEAMPQLGLNLRDARNGDLIFGAREANLDNAIDQIAVGDIDPSYPGMELWANKGLKQLFYSAKGEPIPGPVPPTSELVWWDADLLREQIAPGGVGGFGRGGRSGNPGVSPATPVPAGGTPSLPAGRSIGKWKGPTLTTGIQGQVQQVADILGDWREEIITFTDGELRIYSTTIPATDRRVCLMQDPIYRHDVTHRTMGYAHVPQVSYYLGEK